ncbi:hypothetical protein [Phenylobacterium sp.]|uniref:hypothetical protein n=1 Tax=Phenylobacterium sp. TaxID=1871053 RepID=UPI002FC8B825
MDLASIISAGAGGGLFGIVGQLANRGLAIWEQKEKRKELVLVHAQEEKRWGHEKGLLSLQMQARSEETEQELQLADAQGAWQSFAASQEADSKIGESYKWVAAVRHLTRPFLTMESQILLAIVFFTMKGDGREDLNKLIVETVTFCASASLLWWFGERAQSRRAGK